MPTTATDDVANNPTPIIRIEPGAKGPGSKSRAATQSRAAIKGVA
jgi:hypothetical protein